jgi:putative ABC transport system substrate-binding protein
MRRREFIATGSALAIGWPSVAVAQQATKTPRIGIIDDSPTWEPFREQLRKMKYVEGRNFTYVSLHTDGSSAQLEAAATALVQVPVDVIVVFGTPRAKAAHQATKTIPIVALSISDPVSAGLVPSLGHSAGNVTGTTILGPEIITKKLQILKDAFPSVSRVAYLWNPDNSATAEILEDLRKAAPLFGMTLMSLEARTEVDFDRVFGQMTSEHPDALLLTSDPVHQAHMRTIIDFLAKNRIAGFFQVRENVVAGGLMSYGVSLFDVFRMGAIYTDSILRGTKPADLPFAQPVTFEFVINLKAAKAIGLEIPTTVIARADEVIE